MSAITLEGGLEAKLIKKIYCAGGVSFEIEEGSCKLETNGVAFIEEQAAGEPAKTDSGGPKVFVPNASVVALSA